MNGVAYVLLILQAAASGALILVGSVVEAYGYGLSLGTNWPYRNDIFSLAMRGDPEAWHRILATTLGVNAVILAFLLRDGNAFSGLALIAGTALLGVATLHVLAGKAPAFLHGLHGLLAYATLFAYVSELLPRSPSVWSVMVAIVPVHVFLLIVFLGGMVTGQRGYRRPIGAFVYPRTGGQWVFLVHGLGWALLVLTLAYYVQSYSVALLLALLQLLLGFMLYQAVNDRPSRPGILTVFHQSMALLIFLSLVFAWRIKVPFLG